MSEGGGGEGGDGGGGGVDGGEVGGGGGSDGGGDGIDGGGEGMDGGGEEGGGSHNRSCILLGSLRLLGRQGLEIIVGERTMKGL